MGISGKGKAVKGVLHVLASDVLKQSQSRGVRHIPVHASNGATMPDQNLHVPVQVEQTGDVIEFYNAVFIPSTKAFLLQLGNHSAALLPLPTLTMPGTPLRMGSNPYSLATPPPPDRAAINRCLSPAGKVFVSPMRQPGQQASNAIERSTVPPAILHGLATQMSCWCCI